jgi:predicted permease
MSVTRMTEGLLQDIRHGIRGLFKTPTFTTVALLVLSLSIGAGTAVFSVVDTVALRPLPFGEPDRLVAVLGVDAPTTGFATRGWTTTATFLDWRRMQQSFEAVAMEGVTSFRARNASGELVGLRAEQVTREFFPILRVTPQFGRSFGEDDEIEGRHRVVILSDRYWRQQYAGATDVVGRRLDLNDESWEIVGVLPPHVEYPVASDHPPDIYVPLGFRDIDRTRTGGRNYNWTVIGRLKPGVSIEQADAEMKGIARALDSEFPTFEPGRSARVIALQDRVVGDTGRWLLMLLAAVGFVLLIACANVANLMLARVSARRREIAVRSALGASRWRVSRAVLIDGVVLSGAASAIGAVIAYGSVHVLRSWLPAEIPRAAAIAVDGRVLAIEIGAAFLVGIGFALVPAYQSVRVNTIDTLKSGARGATTSPAAGRLRNALVVVEVAMATALLVGAGLFLASFRNLMAVDLGVDYRNVIVVNGIQIRFDPTGSRGGRWNWTPADSAEARTQRATEYFSQVVAALRRVPGVLDVALNDGGVPIQGSWSRRRITLSDRAATAEDRDVDRRIVTPNYLSLLGIPIVAGRGFTDDDRRGAPPVVLVNEFAARRYWPGQNPIGQHIGDQGLDRVVVGVIRDLRHLGPESPVRQEMYVPMAQDPLTNVRLVVRTSRDPLQVLPAMKAAVWSVNPDQYLTADEYALEGFFDRMIATRRFNMALLVIFGIVGLAIAAAGIFGVMAYTVSQRTNEIGVRMSLGATSSRIVAMVLRHALALVGGGLATGGIAAWYLTRFVQSFLFEIRSGDVSVFGPAIVILAVAGLAAAAVPARRAARVNPIDALRQE